MPWAEAAVQSEIDNKVVATRSLRIVVLYFDSGVFGPGFAGGARRLASSLEEAREPRGRRRTEATANAAKFTMAAHGSQ
jgi:hypothetical protein